MAGAGAAGFFAAIACAERGLRTAVLEKSAEILSKVAISGGGRCNVTHACFEAARLAEFYPRGGRELIGPFIRFQPRDTVAWFESRGVPLKTEPDGRMFPASDRSSSVTQCLERAAAAAGVAVLRRRGLASAQRREGGFVLDLSDGSALACRSLILATGGNAQSGGHAVAASLGHSIEPLVPSLFTFHAEDRRIAGLQGLSVADAGLEAEGLGLRERGAVLVTHWGLSGPAVLRLSARGARVLHDADYAFDLAVNWAPSVSRAELLEEFRAARQARAAKAVRNAAAAGLPLRLWGALASAAGVGADARWGGLSNEAVERLASAVQRCVLRVDGKSMNKEEFVTCGGVRLREVDFRTMQSRVCPGLHLAGEVLDIDGLTGGFNLQAAWTTGWIAGRCAGGGEG